MNPDKLTLEVQTIELIQRERINNFKKEILSMLHLKIKTMFDNKTELTHEDVLIAATMLEVARMIVSM